MTPVYDELSRLATDARTYGQKLGAVDERERIIKLIKKMNPKPSINMQRLLTELESKK